jgi:hypothetical protein
MNTLKKLNKMFQEMSERQNRKITDMKVNSNRKKNLKNGSTDNKDKVWNLSCKDKTGGQ